MKRPSQQVAVLELGVASKKAPKTASPACQAEGYGAAAFCARLQACNDRCEAATGMSCEATRGSVRQPRLPWTHTVRTLPPKHATRTLSRTRFGGSRDKADDRMESRRVVRAGVGVGTRRTARRKQAHAEAARGLSGTGAARRLRPM